MAMPAPSIQREDHEPNRPFGHVSARGCAIVVAGTEALASEVFSRGRRGTWLRLQDHAVSSPPPSPVAARPLRPGGVFDWPCGTFSLIALGSGIERLEDRVLGQVGQLCLSSLDLHGEIHLCLDTTPDESHERTRRVLARALPLFVIRRRQPNGSERYVWRRTLGMLVGRVAPPTPSAASVSSPAPDTGVA